MSEICFPFFINVVRINNSLDWNSNNSVDPERVNPAFESDMKDYYPPFP